MCVKDQLFPSIWIHESDEYAYTDLGEPFMEFRLTYQGALYADRGTPPEQTPQPRLKHKHAIRKQFHTQLSELWKNDSRLKWFTAKNIHEEQDGVSTSSSRLDLLKREYQGFSKIKWAPLVNDIWGVACGLDILFLRHEPKGGIVQAGDLDNRINTLFDALRVPKDNEIPDDVLPEDEPDPFFCLLSDDKLIAEFRVTSDRLLLPGDLKGDANVHLIITVRTFVVDREKAHLSLGKFIHE